MLRKLLVIGLLCNSVAYAAWPAFHVLTPEQITTLETSNGCAAGEVRIPIGTQVSIQNPYIPSKEHWFWVYQGDGQCFAQTENLHYLNLNQNGYEYPSVIIADYGSKNVPLVQFGFHIPKQPWDCGPLYGPIPPVYIGCAYDEKT